MKKSFTIHDLPKSERPRERLQKFGPEALSAQELLALILGRGIPGESVTVTSQRLLSTFGNIKAISEASLEELAEVKGVGPAKACQIEAAHLLYFIIKDHPFVDGNKRIGSFLFVYFLDKNNYLYRSTGEKKINDNALTALSLLIAISDPKDKEVLIKIITNLLGE